VSTSLPVNDVELTLVTVRTPPSDHIGPRGTDVHEFRDDRERTPRSEGASRRTSRRSDSIHLLPAGTKLRSTVGGPGPHREPLGYVRETIASPDISGYSDEASFVTDHSSDPTGLDDDDTRSPG
jgi:hypothetical protein